ncbi:hypothetical protein QBC37DRAFT_482433 [Rhypophila decipiens]|uniref:Uncharacterized protein n=1 Tax=Rhypophila decipiens TaxID=261697 RepID=A0AAN7B7Y0_9PEZI|nr:hypothetical protein QBC37DRAFT_482433 [Rhypophila decipiens]
MKPEYSQLTSRDDQDTLSECSGEVQRRRTRPACWKFFLYPLVPWTLCLILAVLSLFLAVALDRNVQTHALGTFAKGYSTDFITARKLIRVAQTSFTGGPAFDDDGNMFVPHPSPKRFVGDPAVYPDIDYNWNNLTWGRYVLITKDEAAATWGDENFAQYWDKQRGGYVSGFDMFHTLHCLNNLRKALNPAYYGTVAEIGHGASPKGHDGSRTRARSEEEGGFLHQDHCIEQIRQYVMCSGDMTPIPTKYYPGLGRNYVESDVPHTCRNFDLLHDWMVDRYDGAGAVKPVM